MLFVHYHRVSNPEISKHSERGSSAEISADANLIDEYMIDIFSDKLYQSLPLAILSPNP